MSNPDDCFFHYLPANDESVPTVVNLTGAGRFVSAPGDKYPPTGHPTLYNFEWRRGRTLPEFQILLFTDCAGEFESEGTGLARFDDSALVILFPGIWHRYRPMAERGWTERWLSFSGELVYRLFDFRLSGPRLALTKPRDVGRLANDFDDLLNTIHNSPGTDPMLLSLKALRIIVEAATTRFEAAVTHGAVSKDASSYAKVEDPIVREALEIIWSHSHCPMSVNDIARQLPVTRRTLDRRFAEAVGHSVLEEINTCRLSRAKRLLKATDLPVKIVAHLAGFSSAERMRVAFVDHEQTPPLAYRRKHSVK